MPSTFWFPGMGKLRFNNLHETVLLYKDIFISGEYRFTASKKAPVIIDCGAHIGTSVLFFKSLYPNSVITAFEPNPKSFALLSENSLLHKLKRVKLIHAALAEKKGKALLYVGAVGKNPWTWGDSLVRNLSYSTEHTSSISVPTVRLSRYIQAPVDLLKMDIEGAELTVLLEIAHKLRYVKKIILEYHGSLAKKGAFTKIQTLLKRHGFMVMLKRPGKGVIIDSVPREDPFVMIHAERTGVSI
ncbi:MAG: hypothetical protein RLZZ455_341 [Candidatus Parcubacteria bacterium]